MPLTTEDNIINILKNEMKPAFGVTEPIAIALAASQAYSQIGGRIEFIQITINQGLFKNSVNCAIPGTKEKGIGIAAILGVIAGQPDSGLEVLKDVKTKDIDTANKLIGENITKINIVREPGIYVEVEVKASGKSAKSIITNRHDNVVFIEANGNTIYKADENVNDSKIQNQNIKYLSLQDLYNFIETVSYKKISFISEAVRINMSLAKEGLVNDWGIGTGKYLRKLMDKNIIGDDLINNSCMLVAAAIDARLGGAPKPAMSIAGSGSHGCVASLPIIVLAEKKEISQEKMLRSIGLSYLITCYIKSFSGRLSAYCGCAVTAGIGASCGTAYLLGGGINEVQGCIKNMAADITGLICDGGNFGCSLKCASGVHSSLMAAFMSLDGIVVPNNCGIVGFNVEDTIRNIGKVSSPGMSKTDDIIVEILQGIQSESKKNNN